MKNITRITLSSIILLGALSFDFFYYNPPIDKLLYNYEYERYRFTDKNGRNAFVRHSHYPNIFSNEFRTSLLDSLFIEYGDNKEKVYSGNIETNKGKTVLINNKSYSVK